MSKRIVLGIQVTNRVEKIPDVQKILTDYGFNKKPHRFPTVRFLTYRRLFLQMVPYPQRSLATSVSSSSISFSFFGLPVSQSHLLTS